MARAHADTEQQLHEAVVQFLGLALPPHAVWWHTANQGQRTIGAAMKLKRMGLLAGIPDIAVLHAGKLVFLELKRHGGEASDAQIATAGRLRAAGAYVSFCRTLGEVECALRHAGIPLSARMAA